MLRRTSKEAYISNKINQPTQAAQILALIIDEGARGITAGWLSKKMGIPNSTVGARIVELEKNGDIIRLDKTRKNPSGTAAFIIIAAAFKSDALADGVAILPPPAPKEAQSPQAGELEALKARIIILESALSRAHKMAFDLGAKFDPKDPRAPIVTELWTSTLPVPPK